MMTVRLPILLLALTGGACATTPDGPRTASEPDDDPIADGGTEVICAMEADTGSNIRYEVCHRVKPTSAEDRNSLGKILDRPVVQTRTGN